MCIHVNVKCFVNSSVKNNIRPLQIVCLNCCGIKTRLQYPEFGNLIQSYDIVCFVETKTDDVDLINFPGYKFKMKNRKKISNRRSGGIMVGYKESLDNYIDIVNTDSKYVLWFKCSKNLFKTEQPVYFGVVYIPPEHTKYSSEDAFSEIEQEFISFSNISKYVSLLGDFNARTSDENDFVEIDENRHVDNFITEFVENYTGLLNDLQIPLKRGSMDKMKNKYGTLLLNFCKGNSMFIVNGRIGNDKGIGRFTCRNASIVDYCVCSPELLNFITEFEILETNRLLSDVHTPLHLAFKVDKLNNSSDNLQEKVGYNKVKSWDNEKIADFQNNIDEEKLHLFEQKLLDIQNAVDAVGNDTIDTLIDDLGSIFIDSARKTFGTYKCKKDGNTVNSNNKPWFDRDCKFSRQRFRRAKRHYKLNNTIQNRSNMIDAEKRYKKIMNDKYKNFCNKVSNDIKKSSRNDPKYFWKMLGRHKGRQQPSIDINILYEFFKNLNKGGPDEEQAMTENELPDNFNEHINGYITHNEILKCIHNLKNSKASGEDEIINEYIKSTAKRFINIYESLFDIIFF